MQALWDVTGEEVIEVAGEDALEVMNALVPRDLTRLQDGQCLYSVMCYDYGGIVEDAVLVRFNAKRFWWVGGPGSSEQWIYANALGRKVTVTSYLNEKHVASLQGPKSRELLQTVVPADLVPCSLLRDGRDRGLRHTHRIDAHGFHRRARL